MLDYSTVGGPYTVWRPRKDRHYYSGYEPNHTKERLLPDGAVEIIVDLTDTPKKLYDRNDHDRSLGLRRACISGMRRHWIVIEAAPESSMVVICSLSLLLHRRLASYRSAE